MCSVLSNMSPAQTPAVTSGPVPVPLYCSVVNEDPRCPALQSMETLSLCEVHQDTTPLGLNSTPGSSSEYVLPLKFLSDSFSFCFSFPCSRSYRRILLFPMEYISFWGFESNLNSTSPTFSIIFHQSKEQTFTI